MRIYPTILPCSLDECPTLAVARGLCDKHYRRWKKHGDPTAIRYAKRAGIPLLPLEVRFWRHVDRSDGCWEWQASRDRGGYGRFQTSKTPLRRVFAHRMAWELTYGPIPEGLLVCHHCDNPPCVRPGHLFVGTNADNQNDMRAKGRRPLKSLCRNGHPYSGHNLISRGRGSSSRRDCRTCGVEAARRYRAKKKIQG